MPAWMTHEPAARYQVRAEPRLSLDVLRSLRAEIEALLRFLRSDPGMEDANKKAQERKHRAGRAARVAGPLTEGPPGNARLALAAASNASAESMSALIIRMSPRSSD